MAVAYPELSRPSIIARFRPLSQNLEGTQECMSVIGKTVQLTSNDCTHNFSYDQILVFA